MGGRSGGQKKEEKGIAEVERYPGFIGRPNIAGRVTIKRGEGEGFLKVEYDLTGTPPNYRGYVNIHRGMSCHRIKKHLFKGKVDEWKNKLAKYKSDSTGRARGSFGINPGLSLKDVDGHALLVHGVNASD